MKYKINSSHGGHLGIYPKFNTDDINYLIGKRIINNPEELSIKDWNLIDGYEYICKLHNGDYTVIVIYSDGGNEPHFHIVDTETMGDKFDSAIKILSPDYYTHSDNDAQDKLTLEIANELNETFHDPWADGFYLTKWQTCLKLFTKEFHPDEKYKKFNITLNTKQPDYTKLIAK